MTSLIPAKPTFDANLPGATFSNPVAYHECAPERRRYEAAVQAFATAASPEALRSYVSAMRRHGIRSTQADARRAAVTVLRSDLQAIGYDETAVQWHAARRGRRDRHFHFMAQPTTARSWDEIRRRADREQRGRNVH